METVQSLNVGQGSWLASAVYDRAGQHLGHLQVDRIHIPLCQLCQIHKWTGARLGINDTAHTDHSSIRDNLATLDTLLASLNTLEGVH